MITSEQKKALHPYKNIWVSAFAGSGKTKVLVDRMLALMLERSEPKKLLCLTFTKNAAAEMRSRIQERLYEWTQADKTVLTEELQDLLLSPPTPSILDHARQLFFLFSEHSCKIQTIHSFCTSLIEKYPLENGIPPYFHILEDIDQKKLFKEAYRQTLCAPEMIQETLRDLAYYHSESMIYAHLIELFEKKKFFSYDLSVYPTLLKHFLGPQPTFYTTIFFTSSMIEHLETIVALHGSEKDKNILQLFKESPRFSENYNAIFLTQSGEERKAVFSSSVQKHFPELAELEAQEKKLLRQQQACEHWKKLHTLSIGYYKLFSHFHAIYELLKQKHCALEFDDLITYAGALFQNPSTMGPVLSDLHQEIDHILIDEAQDTSADQWELLRSLAEGLLTASPEFKTLFVVGDPKQSIYRFQGASPQIFHKTKAFFKTCIEKAGAKWEEVFLTTSFRSTPVILNTVDQIFSHKELATSLTEPAYKNHHSCSKFNALGGKIEIWPLLSLPKIEEIDSWNSHFSPSASCKELMAKEWAIRIASWLKANTFYLQTQKRNVQARDILFLVLKRDAFFDTLIRELHKNDVPVSGHDRISLLDDLAIQDLICLGKWLVSPQDDWTLACLLKSTFFECDEDMLFELCTKREKRSLLKHLTTLDQLPSYHFAHTILQKLNQWKYLYEQTASPLALYTQILLKEKHSMLSRLEKSIDPLLTEFLSLCESFEKIHSPSLFSFLHWIEDETCVVKRESAHTTRNEVRVMTVHGAKGLQAPVVILPDANRFSSKTENFLYQNISLHPNHLFFIPRPSQKEDTPFTYQQKTSAAPEKLDEYRRLLYVAMTRAQEHLYISGWNTKSSEINNSWYDLLFHHLNILKNPFTFHSKTVPSWKGEGFSIGTLHPPSCMTSSSPSGILSPLPKWAITPIPSIPPVIRTSFCSFIEGNPLQKKLGQWVHQLLDELSLASKKEIYPKALAFLNSQNCPDNLCAFWAKKLMKS